MKELTREIPSPNGGATLTSRPRRGEKRLWLLIALALLGVAGIAYALRPKAAPRITTSPIARKTLVASVTATGTVNPQDTISVGTQVSGTIETIQADYNDRVHRGQILARLDPTLFVAALDAARGTLSQAQAQWQAARANAGGANSTALAAVATADAAAQNVRVAQAAVSSADADVEKSRAALALAQATVGRDAQLLALGFVAKSQYDTDSANEVAASSALKSAVAAARQSRLQLSAARSQAAAGTEQSSASASQATASGHTASADLAAIDAAQAQVRQAQINLDHTIITSPVDGTVIARNVSIGQTVAASFQTPVLYTIAKDLTKMEIDLAVGEPDIGSVRVGQPVDFTVLAYPDHTFHGTVAQVRENPTTIQNVVTYDTVVYENNADGRLRPGMTANASINVARANDALVVPLAALTFRGGTPQPQASAIAPQGGQASVWGNTGAAESAALVPGSLARVLIVDEHNTLHAIPVRVTLVSAGEAAVVPLGQALVPGERVATSYLAQQSETAARAPGVFR